MPAFAQQLVRSLYRSASLLSLCLLLTSSPARSAQKKQGEKTPLTSVEAVTDIDAPKDPDDPGTGGGMDAANYFSRKLAPKLSDCTSRIRATSNDWMQASHLQATKVDQQPGDLLIHATKPDLQGFFEIIYRVKLSEQRARVTVFFYKLDGTQLEPATILPLLNAYKIGDFEEKLTHALLCGSD